MSIGPWQVIVVLLIVVLPCFFVLRALVGRKPTKKQLAYLAGLAQDLGLKEAPPVETRKEASRMIETMLAQKGGR